MALRVIWQFMDRDVTHKIWYGPKRSWVPYIILWVTDRSINCHLARSAMNYLLYYTQYMQICQTTCFCYCISKTKNELGQNPEENIILIGPGQYIANSSWHWGSYGSIWTGPSPNKYYMDRSFWHELFAILYFFSKNNNAGTWPVHILPVNIRKEWPAALTKINRQNKNVKCNILKYWPVNITQLFNESAGNRSKYFSRGIGKDQSVILPEVNDRGQYYTVI
jgi:hypothetical protein